MIDFCLVIVSVRLFGAVQRQFYFLTLYCEREHHYKASQKQFVAKTDMDGWNREMAFSNS